MALTLKQEAFCQAYIENKGNASEAYRTAYATGKMKLESIHVNASKLLADTKVALRISELQQEHRNKHDVTVSGLLEELEEARQKALTAETPQASAAVAATMGKARLTGLDKVLIDLTADVKVEDRSIKDIFDG
ncbi:terminase small subunit [Providencia alcalifaciens]|uniref:terminase small subunit n=1 Tax=Providencia alcalifaciens TaxID=126385 RepID=UPI000D362294|nr:terminase small subunit [Providencia alcalifaciens]MBG5881506.1 terminase small subunit [Providencia alcalifaciens]